MPYNGGRRGGAVVRARAGGGAGAGAWQGREGVGGEERGLELVAMVGEGLWRRGQRAAAGVAAGAQTPCELRVGLLVADSLRDVVNNICETKPTAILLHTSAELAPYIHK